MNVALYLRVSTDEQTLDPQHFELQAHCTRNGWQVVGEWTDVISGAKADRPGLAALMDACAVGGIDAVVVVKLDRLGRSVLNVVGLVQRLKEMDVAVICTSQGIDTRDSNPCGKMILSVMAAFAEFERDIIRERTKAGLASARAQGRVGGQASPVLAALGPERTALIVAEWRAQGGRGLRRLARMLGGVAVNTAARLAKG